MVLYVPRLRMPDWTWKVLGEWRDVNGRTESRVVSKTRSLRWLEGLRESQRLTAREERRKEEVLEVFRELYDISARNPRPPVFPPWRPSW
jgi:hypothetical protein